MKKETVAQTVKIVIFSILFLLLSVFSILALTPERSNVQVRETFTVSSSLVSKESGTYLLEVTGTLRNKTGSPIVVDRVTVRVSGIDGQFSTAEPIFLAPRADAEVLIRAESDRSSSAVTGVWLTSGDDEIMLRNPAVTDLFGYAFLPILLALLFLLLLIHAVIVRVYMAQEAKLATLSEETPVPPTPKKPE